MFHDSYRPSSVHVNHSCKHDIEEKDPDPDRDMCRLVPGGGDEDRVKKVMQYSFFLSRDDSHPFHPHNNYWNDMDALGVHLEAVGSKKGAVDIKMKMRMSALGEMVEVGTGSSGCVVMVIAGDRDFIPELTRLCNAGSSVALA